MTTPKATNVLAQLLAGTRIEELDCDTFAEFLPAWVEGRSPADLREALQQHLEMCPECEEERILLLQAVGDFSDGDGPDAGPDS